MYDKTHYNKKKEKKKENVSASHVSKKKKNGNPSYKESIKHFIPIYRNNNAGVNNQH